jgi:hypothetical protein
MFHIFLVAAFVKFTPFPERKDAIFANENKKLIEVKTSGSIGLYYGGKCHKTYGNNTISPEEEDEWCSNIVRDKGGNPWIAYSIKGKQMKVSKYAVRNGCCKHVCCCDDDISITEETCCCMLYSYSLLASNDNITWTTLHKVEKDMSFDFCGTKEFELNEVSKPFTFIKFQMDQEYPGCLICMQINQIELYGNVVSSGFTQFGENYDDDEESISIIGRIRRDD